MKKTVSSCETLTELLQWRYIHSSNEVALILEGKSYTYGWLWENSRRFASHLAGEGVVERDRILVLVPNSAAFFIAFYGSMFCGAIVVPIFPNAGTERCSQIMKLCGCTHIILPDDISKTRKIEFDNWTSIHHISTHWVNEHIAPGDKGTDFPDVLYSDIAFIQFTSGSTDFPKGVPLTHQNLLTNIKQMIVAMRITDKDVFVSWLPVYHDMGLILNTMVPFYTKAILVLLAVGMHRIHSWLKAIEEYGGTFISAPDIAYRLCVKSIRRPQDYDLSSLRVALNASEPIHLSTYRLFEDAFNLRNVMVSGYGLAEATVAVAMHPPGQPPVVDAHGYVASGKPVEGVDIRIDCAGLNNEKEQVGEILVKSPAVMKGYYMNKVSDSFDHLDYLRTGDVGYSDSEGNLFVLSRIKNIIIHAGHTLYPDDVEQAVASLRDIRNVAALGIKNPKTGSENLYLFAELHRHNCSSQMHCHNLAIEIVQKIYDHFGIRPAKVFLLKPKSIPHTPNGKLQYAELRKLYTNDFLNFSKNILYS